MKSRTFFQTAGLLFLITLTGCANAMRLAYTKPAMSQSKKGKLSVSITDQRVANRGGDNPFVVGQARNAFGMPFAIKAAKNREPVKVARELLADCLAAAGYEVVDTADDIPRLDAVLEVFWSDGYQHSRMGLVMPMELKQHKKSTPVWHYKLDINTGFSWRSAGFSQFNRGFDNMLNTATDKLIKQFQSPDFQKQYRRIK